LHDQEGRIAVRLDVVHRDDMIVHHRRCGPAFAGESLSCGVYVRQMRGQRLDGHGTIHLAVVRFEHSAHASVELDRPPIPVEYRPLDATVVSLLCDAHEMRE